ncbi:hypothetical protein ACPPVV_11715 [Rhodanobacter sp. Col0626]|uniref:hypothetical protein n=1 Tax=Rhodanobacter sp. Col0626 TaxID=3415679 RepID=UPI003CE912F9
MSMTGNEDQDAPDSREEQNNPARKPEQEQESERRASESRTPTPHVTTVPRIKPS